METNGVGSGADGGLGAKDAAAALSRVKQARTDQLAALRGPRWVTLLLILGLGVVVASWSAPFPEARPVGMMVLVLTLAVQLIVQRRAGVGRIKLPGPYRMKVLAAAAVGVMVIGGGLVTGHVALWGAQPYAWLINGGATIVLGVVFWLLSLRFEEQAFAAARPTVN